MKNTYTILLTLLAISCQADSDGPGPEALLALMAGGDSMNSTCPSLPFPDGVHLADTVTKAPGATGTGFGDAQRAVSGICGAGESSGSVHSVYPLQSDNGDKYMILEWSGRRVLPESSPGKSDFIVFENSFRYGNQYMMEPIIVEVTAAEPAANNDFSNVVWCGWQPDYTGEKANGDPDPDHPDRNLPENWERFAGLMPVLFNQDSNRLGDDPNRIMDPDQAGGNGFNLDDASFACYNSDAERDNCDTSGDCGNMETEIQDDGFVYMRLTTAHSRDPVAFPMPDGSFDMTADIDGVIAANTDSRE